MRRIELEATFEGGTLWTIIEAETLQDALDKINKDYPKLLLTVETVKNWKYADVGQTLTLF